MPPVPVQVAFDRAHAKSAKAIHDCAKRFDAQHLPSGPNCRITLFASAYVPPVEPAGDITTMNPVIFQPDEIMTIEIQE